MFEGVYLLREWNGVATARSHVVIRKLYFLGFRKQIKSDKIHLVGGRNGFGIESMPIREIVRNQGAALPL